METVPVVGSRMVASTNALCAGFASLHGPWRRSVAVSSYGVASPPADRGLGGTTRVQFGLGTLTSAAGTNDRDWSRVGWAHAVSVVRLRTRPARANVVSRRTSMLWRTGVSLRTGHQELLGVNASGRNTKQGQSGGSVRDHCWRSAQEITEQVAHRRTRQHLIQQDQVDVPG